MRWLIVLFLTACSGAKVNSYLDRYSNQTLILTYFKSDKAEVDSFRQTQAKIIAEQFEAKIKQMKVVICPLPEEYDRSAGVALECLSHANGNYILALNFENSCQLLLETAATNKDHEPDRADIAGQVYTDRIIDPAETSERVGFTWPAHKMFCAINRVEQNKIRLSIRLSFVANNLAFHLAEHSIKAPFTMITLPEKECSDREFLVKRAAELLVFHFVEDGVSLWRPLAMPTSLQETIEMRAAVPKHSCEANFLDSLEAMYQSAESKLNKVKDQAVLNEKSKSKRKK